MCSVGSLEGMVPVCSSSQQEDDVKERRVSIPDILMSWGGGTPQATILKMADKELPQNNHQLPSHKSEEEHEKSIYQILAESRNSPVVADSADAQGVSSSNSETLVKILKLPFALHELLSESRGENEPLGLVGSVTPCLPYRDELQCSLNKSHKLCEDEQENGNKTNPHEDTTEIVPCQMRRKMNESVWSVESLAPFIPSKEWLLQNSMFEPEVIIEMTEEAENDNQIVKPTKEREQICRLSSSDSAPMSDSWLIFSTPADKLNSSKKPEMESEIDASEMREQSEGQCMVSSEKASPTHLQSKIVSTPPEEDVDEHRSSEPEANQSPNQESLIENEHREKCPCSPKQGETQPLDSVAEEKSSPTSQMVLQNGVDMEVDNGADENQEVGHLGNEQLCVPMADQKMAEVSLLKGQLVDCGTQCTQFQELCPCERSSVGLNRRHPFKYSDMKRENNGKAEGFYVNGNMQKNQKRHNHWRSRGQEKQGNQQDAYNGYSGKPGKSKGGNGRNPRY
ncbi:uro-adherence factor A-like [Pempheris klunzingeri]|uniref:uro-adherence factor A-like n=1 Tax=Pempheris klunzingeri TaxID=3127111 RepID=UPI003981197B